MNNIQLIIPMSGIGKRFIDAGYTVPKPLIEVDGIPIIQHVVNLFPNVTDITFICNEKHLRETNMREILLSIAPQCKIYEVPNENRRGPVDAVWQIASEIDQRKEVIISYCDYGTDWDFEGFIKAARAGKYAGSIACYTGFHPHMLNSDNYAFCKEKNMELVAIKEKEAFTNDKMSEYASNGTYYFKNGRIVRDYFKRLIDLDINLRGEYYVSLVYTLLLRDGLRTNIFEINNMLQWGTPYDLAVYNEWSEYFRNIIVKQDKVKNPKDTKLILPMAGRGSRFADDGFDLPKPLLDVNGLPMVIQAVNCLPECDSNIFICLEEHIDEFNIDKVIKNTYHNTEVVSLRNVTQGQACTCELGLKNFQVDLEKPIMISACDNGVYYDSNEYLNLVNDESVDIIVWTFRNNQTSKVNPNSYAWLDVDENNCIKHVSCKKFIYDDISTTHAIIGTMFFRKGQYFMNGLNKNYDENIRTNNEFYVDDVLNQNIKAGLTVKVFEVKNYICWGAPNDYKTYNYWRDFFNKCEWHPYKIENDITYGK